MTAMDGFREWAGVLGAATVQARSATAPMARLEMAGEGLRLVWATAQSVESHADVDAALVWTDLVESVAEASDDLELVSSAPPVLLGTGSGPDGSLVDTAALRQAVQGLLTAVHAAVGAYAAEIESGRDRLLAVLAAGKVERAVAVCAA